MAELMDRHLLVPGDILTVLPLGQQYVVIGLDQDYAQLVRWDEREAPTHCRWVLRTCPPVVRCHG